MKELDGYAGKMLRVDLSSGEVTEFSSSRIRSYLLWQRSGRKTLLG